MMFGMKLLLFRWARDHCAAIYTEPPYNPGHGDVVSMHCPVCVHEHREGRRLRCQVHTIMIQFRPDGRVITHPGGRRAEIDPADPAQVTCGYHRLNRPVAEWGAEEYMEWAYRTGNVVRGDD